jgi:hypothetical protein
LIYRRGRASGQGDVGTEPVSLGQQHRRRAFKKDGRVL